jgi:DNA-binding transcriptional ArsR family regulator
MGLYHIGELIKQLPYMQDEIPCRIVPPPEKPKRSQYFGAKPKLETLAKVASLRDPALPAFLSLLHQQKLSKGGHIRCSSRVISHLGMTDQQFSRGLEKLEQAGMLRYVTRGRGRRTVVELLV